MCLEKYARNLGFGIGALAALGVLFYSIEYEPLLSARTNARFQRPGALNTCPRKETAFMSAQTCLSGASSSSCDARAVMRASKVDVRPISSSTNTARPTSGVTDTTRALTTLRTDSPEGRAAATITSRANTWIWIR